MLSRVNYSPVAHLAWAHFLGSDSAQRLMMFAAGFFDASGKANGSIALAVGGYAASRGRWELFEREWNEQLKDCGIEYFRMSEFINRRGQFSNWTPEQASELFDNLSVIISECIEIAIGCVILLNDY